MRFWTPLLLLLALGVPASAEREFDVDGPIELHIWLTTKPDQERAFERTFREVFYPAVSAREGFRSAALMRKPGTSDYTVRLLFNSEEQRMEWVKSDAHQQAWPALAEHCQEPKYDGFAVIHPRE